MGCHTWFYRPLIKDELDKVKKCGPVEIEELTVKDKYLRDLLMESYDKDTPCAWGCYWWELGYGTGCLEGSVKAIRKRLYMNVEEYNDAFRVSTYPGVVIHNKYELRKYLKARYFELYEGTQNKITEFFTVYPGGVIVFG